jgi:alkylhydroperoxidase family enzyme
MSLIETVKPKDATGEVAAIYQQLQKTFGRVPNGVAAFSASPHRLKVQVGEMGYYGSHPRLSRELTAAIRYVVAADHGCDYCVMVNAMMLKGAGWSEEVVAGLPANPRPERQGALPRRRQGRADTQGARRGRPGGAPEPRLVRR